MNTTFHADLFADPGMVVEPPRLCSVCGLVVPGGDQVCPRCGETLEIDVDTLTLGDAMRRKASQPATPKGQLMGEPGQSVILEIEGQVLPLPDANELIVGRISQKDDYEPDVDLDMFQARARGVSRYHLTLRRRGRLVYISDAGSRNGTWLNGHRLIPHATRLVRDGDEIQLGELKMVIRFT